MGIMFINIRLMHLMDENSETDIYFHGIPQPVRLIRCAPLLDMIRDIFPTWPFRLDKSSPESTPIITVRRAKGEYMVDAPWLDDPIFSDTGVCAFSSIVVDVIYAWLEANLGMLCLHCAAVDFDGRLVVFPNTNKVGKSLLAARLMAENYTCYGDDLIALTPEGKGMSFGVPPRLRLPLPTSEKTVKEFIRTHRGKADASSVYIAPDIPALAPFGQTRPIGALVMLLRKAEAKAELVPANSSDSLRNMVYQNLMRRGSALQVLECSTRLTEEIPCWYLRYARLDDAVALLHKAFIASGNGFSRQGQEHFSSHVNESVTPAQNKSRSRVRHRRASQDQFVRRSDVLIRQGQGEFFLIQESGDEIFHLNTIGRAVWELLAEPLSETEAVLLLASVFPDIPDARIERDVIDLFTDLKKNELLCKA